jgi:histidine kinase/histidine kinase/DNA gyrase B/HSP90-like ATPase
LTPIRELLALRLASPPPDSCGRLSDYRWAGRVFPLAAFIAIAVLVYLWHGPTATFWLLIKLWFAYSAAWLVLAGFAALRGHDPPWREVIPAALAAVTLGGMVAALIAFAPNWSALIDIDRVAPEWGLAAGFAAFFVGLSLVTAELRRRDRLAADTRRQLLEARLQALTAQIEPHFLMNTLANLRYLINSDSKAASQMLEHLASFLQGALDRSRAARSTLGQELALVASYLSIMQFRLGERLRFRIAVPDELADVPFPPLLLQTLVENALRHGIEPKREGGVIDITAERRGIDVVLRVCDDGVGLAADSTPGVGLRNTRERLASFYQGRASFELERGTQCGTVAAISIPAVAA